MDESGRSAVKTQYRQLAIICGALIFAAANYMFIAALVSGSGSKIESVRLPVSVLAVIALLFLGFAPVVFRMIMQGVPANSTVETRMAKLKIATIVSFAVREATAIIGFVLTMLTGDLRWVVGLGAITIFAMIAAFPRWSRFEARMKEIPPIG